MSDNNGGAYENITLFSGVNLTVDGVLNTRVTSAAHNFVAADVGTRILVTGGTGWTTGYYTITGTVANAADLSSSPAAVGTAGGVWAEVGIDYSLQNAPQVAIGGGIVTTSVTTNVITFTGGTYTPSNKDVGNYVQVISGTNTTPNSFFRISSVGATTWTMDSNVVSAGTTVNMVANMGGALLTLPKLAAKMIASNKAFVTGAFTATAATAITFAQTVAAATPAAPPTRILGYGASRGDSGRATITLSTNIGQTGITLSGTNFWIDQIDVDCAGLATSTGVNLGAGTFNAYRTGKISNFTTAGLTLGAFTASFVVDCEFTGGTAAATAALNANSGMYIYRCFVHDNVCPGVIVSNGAVVIENLIANNSGATSDGLQITQQNTVLNNTIHNNGRHGINQTGGTMIAAQWRNNLLTNNVGFGIVGGTTAVPARADLDGNAFFSNGLGSRSAMDSLAGSFAIAPYTNVRDVTLSGSPYVGPTTGPTANFNLNNLPGAGNACRGAGAPQSWLGNSGTSSRLDMGAAQHRDQGTPHIITAP